MVSAQLHAHPGSGIGIDLLVLGRAGQPALGGSDSIGARRNVLEGEGAVCCSLSGLAGRGNRRAADGLVVGTGSGDAEQGAGS